METWQVNLLGPPQARCGQRFAALRSRQTWALLASLLLEPTTNRRAKLALRFWPEGNGRKSLGMALLSLRAAFGADSVIADADTACLRRERFHTDLDQLKALQESARAMVTTEDRLRGWQQAACLLRGPFLEECDLFLDGDGWLAFQRESLKPLYTQTLLGLAGAQQETGDPDAAFETLVRALRFCPDDSDILRALMTLGAQAGKQSAVERLARELGVAEERTPPGPQSTAPPGPPLRTDAKEVVEALSVFAASFSAAWARRVSPAATYELLQELENARYLRCLRTEVGEERFLLPPVLRESLWRNVPTPRQRTLRAAYAACVMRSRLADAERTGSDHAHVEATGRWLLGQRPDSRRLRFVEGLAHAGFVALTEQVYPWLERAATDQSLPTALRQEAILVAGGVCIQRRAFAAAREWYLTYLAEHAESDRIWHYLSQNAVASLHAGDTEEAVRNADEALRLLGPDADPGVRAGILFTRAEALYASGKLTEASVSCAEALELRRALSPESQAVAASLYQWGVIQGLIGNEEVARTTFDAAMCLFYRYDDRHGVADCLRRLALIRAHQGMHGEAWAHTEHARMLYVAVGNDASVAATWETQGDLRRLHGDTEGARALYQESLAFWKRVGHPRWIPRLKARLAAL